MLQPTIIPVSENALVLSLEPPATLEHQQKLWAFESQVKASALQVAQAVLGINNITLFFKLHTDLTSKIPAILELWHATQTQTVASKHVKIPVHYGGQYGEDLHEVARLCRLSPERVVEQHSSPHYTVMMLGFQAGFPYLFGLPKALHTPRKATPRTLIAAGSVGIGGSQTGIYPLASPGGWQIIGRTDTVLFRAQHKLPAQLLAGDTVQFVVESLTL